MIFPSLPRPKNMIRISYIVTNSHGNTTWMYLPSRWASKHRPQPTHQEYLDDATIICKS